MRARPALLLATAVLALVTPAGCTSTPAARHTAAAPPAPTSTHSSAAPTTAAPSQPRPSRRAKPHRTPPPTPPTTLSPTSTARHTAPARHVTADHLPLDYPTGSARQVVTVVAGAQDDTQGMLQTWRRVSGGWRRVGPAVPAWLGSDGMTPHPSESLSAVPMGSYSLTQAFGHDPDPGTALPYRQTTPADWWISEAGPYYNTEQHCSGSCPFTQGSPNEHLYYETPYYDYAVVIDYNRTPVRQGAGSAFFLHVSVGSPTQGCVAIDMDQLLRILRWLRPADHPRIVIGTS